MYFKFSSHIDNDNLPLPCPPVVTFDRIPKGNPYPHYVLHLPGDLQTRHWGVLLCHALRSTAEHTPLRMVLVYVENDFISWKLKINSLLLREFDNSRSNMLQNGEILIRYWNHMGSYLRMLAHSISLNFEIHFLVESIFLSTTAVSSASLTLHEREIYLVLWQQFTRKILLENPRPILLTWYISFIFYSLTV